MDTFEKIKAEKTPPLFLIKKELGLDQLQVSDKLASDVLKLIEISEKLEKIFPYDSNKKILTAEYIKEAQDQIEKIEACELSRGNRFIYALYDKVANAVSNVISGDFSDGYLYLRMTYVGAASAIVLHETDDKYMDIINDLKKADYVISILKKAFNIAGTEKVKQTINSDLKTIQSIQIEIKTRKLFKRLYKNEDYNNALVEIERLERIYQGSPEALEFLIEGKKLYILHKGDTLISKGINEYANKKYLISTAILKEAFVFLDSQRNIFKIDKEIIKKEILDRINKNFKEPVLEIENTRISDIQYLKKKFVAIESCYLTLIYHCILYARLSILCEWGKWEPQNETKSLPAAKLWWIGHTIDGQLEEMGLKNFHDLIFKQKGQEEKVEKIEKSWIEKARITAIKFIHFFSNHLFFTAFGRLFKGLREMK